MMRILQTSLKTMMIRLWRKLYLLIGSLIMMHQTSSKMMMVMLCLQTKMPMMISRMHQHEHSKSTNLIMNSYVHCLDGKMARCQDYQEDFREHYTVCQDASWYNSQEALQVFVSSSPLSYKFTGEFKKARSLKRSSFAILRRRIKGFLTGLRGPGYFAWILIFRHSNLLM